MKGKFSINPVAVIVWIWLFVMLGAMSAMSYLVAILLHELAHFFMAKKLGYTLSKFSISPYGVALSYHEQNFSYKDEIKIALAGPAINIISAFAVLAVWWLFPVTYFFTESFVMISMVIALFNLLPAYPLDGGRVFIGASSHYFKQSTARKITMFVNIFLGVIFFIVFLCCLFINFNPTYLLFSLFLLIGCLDLNFGSKFDKMSIFCKKERNFAKTEVCTVYQNVTVGELVKRLQTTKTQLFILVLNNGKIVNLSEKMIINFSINYTYDTKIEEILKIY